MLHPELPLHLLELARRYGPVYRLRFGAKDVVVLNSVDSIRQALTQKWFDFAGRPSSFVADLISLGGHDLSLGDFTPGWRLQRKVAHSALARAQRLQLDPVLGVQAAALCQVFRSYGGAAVDVAEDFSLQTCRTICAMAFGPMMPDAAAIQDIHDCITELVALWGRGAVRALDALPLLRVFPSGALRRLLLQVRFRDAFVRAQIQRHQESLRPECARDMVDHMLQLLEERRGAGAGAGGDPTAEGGLTPEHVHMALVDLFIGGTETTAALLTWAVAFLLHHPQPLGLHHPQGHHRDPQPLRRPPRRGHLEPPPGVQARAVSGGGRPPAGPAQPAALQLWGSGLPGGDAGPGRDLRLPRARPARVPAGATCSRRPPVPAGPVRHRGALPTLPRPCPVPGAPPRAPRTPSDSIAPPGALPGPCPALGARPRAPSEPIAPIAALNPPATPGAPAEPPVTPCTSKQRPVPPYPSFPRGSAVSHTAPV
ncbi:steroid 21-hydroxylase isoform X1 [Dermochelys coriacea]|uniref:steroid 21-hydroxylase isoform X1 n=1 Tax=Dermochelys coriacea TaxID=27794 RepID=UPI001CA87C6A|nr:steroid 21-hydroxylase isoform X1 [Dermochelys coriacea]